MALARHAWREPPARERTASLLATVRRVHSARCCGVSLRVPVARPPTGPDSIHEIKHDGYRLIARKDAGRVALWTRHGTDFTDRLPRIAEAVRSLAVDSVLIDGEAVVFRRIAQVGLDGNTAKWRADDFRRQPMAVIRAV